MDNNYTINEEVCIFKLLQLCVLKDNTETPQEVEKEALERGLRLEKCKSVAEFLLDHDELMVIWLKEKSKNEGNIQCSQEELDLYGDKAFKFAGRRSK